MSDNTHATADSPANGAVFHEGERTIQRLLGVEEKMDMFARRVVREYMPEQHRELFAQLPFILAGAPDIEGKVWATIYWGQPGFVSSPDPKTLSIRLPSLSDDPLEHGLSVNSDIGLLGIQLSKRRRNRMNGTIAARTPDSLTVSVRHSFGNCPRYIQVRESHFIDVQPSTSGPAQRREELATGDRTLIASADTFFIASVCAKTSAGVAKGADVSHRGGKPGFVRIDDDRTLTIPDFNGNLHFNTLGNLLLDPRCGLLFIDWDTGDLLHITAAAEIVWDGPEVSAFAGAERLVRFHINEIVRRPRTLPLRFSAPEFSPVLANTGDWETRGSGIRN